jgi:hypothetical protein
MKSKLALALSMFIMLAFTSAAFAQGAPATPSAPSTPSTPGSSPAGDQLSRDTGKKDDTVRGKKHKRQKHKPVRKPVQQ